MDIIKELGGLVTSQIVKQAANSFGESESGISSVIGSLAPTILGGLLNKSSNDSAGFGQIFDMLSNKDNASYLDNLGGLLGGGNLAQNDPKDVGGGLLGSLFGDKVGGIIDLVSSLAGVKKSSSSGLLGMVAPMIMGYLGKKILKEGLSAAGLGSFLGGQRNNIASAMPQGLADMIGFDMPEGILDKAKDAVEDAAGLVTGTAGKVVDTAGDTAKAAAGAVGNVAGKTAGVAGDAAKATAGMAGDAAKSGGNMLMKILPLLALGAIALFAWKQCGDDAKGLAGDAMETVGDAAKATGAAVGDAASATVDAAGNVVEAAGDVAGDAASAVGGAIGNLGDFLGRKLSNGVELNIPEFGVESKLLDFLDSKDAISKDAWYNFDRLNFATGSAALDIEASQEQISNIVQIMKAYPNMEVKIGGYTDNTGNPEANQKLSEARANTVKNAIANLGIEAGRITTEGYGDAHPVATNDTAEGRAQNRRIAVRVTKK